MKKLTGILLGTAAVGVITTLVMLAKKKKSEAEEIEVFEACSIL